MLAAASSLISAQADCFLAATFKDLEGGVDEADAAAGLLARELGKPPPPRARQLRILFFVVI